MESRSDAILCSVWCSTAKGLHVIDSFSLVPGRILGDKERTLQLVLKNKNGNFQVL